MFEMMLEGLRGLMTISSLGFMAVGTLVGVIFGCIPGLTGGIAIALCLPYTFYLDVLPAMSLLIGIYAGSEFGGSIPAILVGTPGTPQASITILDGYPMAKNGQSGKALKTALYSSVCGNFFASFFTIFMLVGLSSLALMMGPAELFSVTVFSIILIATIGSKGAWIKGLLAAFVGLLFSFVGSDPITGIPRFVFSYNMLGGIELIPVLMGLFVGSGILTSVNIPSKKLEFQKYKTSDKRFTKEEIKSCIPLILSGSLIGAVIGALPGLNAAVSSTLNYTFAKRISKHPERFGTGIVEGVCAPECANNATAGPTLAPLLTLGIPGSGTAAIFMGALLIKGIQVGPTIFRDHGDVVYGIFFSIMICSLLLLLLGRFVINFAQYIVFIPAEILNPVIIFICIAGVYAGNSSLLDVFMFLIFLLIGYLMKLASIPVLPLLIAFLLGDTMEANFRRSLVISQGSLGIFFQSTISLIFLLITAIILLYTILGPVIKKNIAKGKQKNGEG